LAARPSGRERDHLFAVLARDGFDRAGDGGGTFVIVGVSAPATVAFDESD
jgi:hypothetical protein